MSAPERFVFVRDGFHVWAFMLTPLWLLAHRLWLAFIIYVVGYGLVGVAFAFLRVPANTQLLARPGHRIAGWLRGAQHLAMDIDTTPLEHTWLCGGRRYRNG